jgi:hypothetical protein
MKTIWEGHLAHIGKKGKVSMVLIGTLASCKLGRPRCRWEADILRKYDGKS